MKMERHEIDLDNFIKERIRGFRSQKFAVEPTPDFTKRTMSEIYRLEKSRRLTYGLLVLWTLSPLTLRQFWFLIRNDYFRAANLPFGDTVVGVYQFFLSWAGVFLLLAGGVVVSFLFVLKLRRGGLDLPPKPVKIA
jgi:hypothetical protein